MNIYDKLLELTDSDTIQLAGEFRNSIGKELVLGQTRFMCRYGKALGFTPMPPLGPFKLKQHNGMLLQAIREYGIDPAQSLMLGDKVADMQAAAAAGVPRKVLVLSGQSLSAEDQQSADEVWPSISTALTAVL